MSKFKVGDRVVNILKGLNGVVVSISSVTYDREIYPIVVKYEDKDGTRASFTKEGYEFSEHIQPALYPEGTTITVNIPKEKIYEYRVVYVNTCYEINVSNHYYKDETEFKDRCYPFQYIELIKGTKRERKE